MLRSNNHKRDKGLPMSNNSGFTGLIIAKVICCGGLVLLAGTGALAGLGGWLSDNAWLIAVAVGLGVAALVLYLRPNAPTNKVDPASDTGE
ncbi:MAG: hypothetical protein O7G13_01375 [Alphaproteobacteria bacterium]|nr:hypothetical protein [Alphaproteobacteria bacterium]MCZ6837903.1 hypothetical protein [Alphaproteobacteria bacterium]MCZ6845232.1 hypothetical protein [Alphaproteobacteria bacterium]